MNKTIDAMVSDWVNSYRPPPQWAPPPSGPATTATAASAPRVAPASAPRVAAASAPRVAPASAPRVAPASAPRVAPASAPRVAPASAPRVAPASAPPAPVPLPAPVPPPAHAAAASATPAALTQTVAPPAPVPPPAHAEAASATPAALTQAAAPPAPAAALRALVYEAPLGDLLQISRRQSQEYEARTEPHRMKRRCASEDLLSLRRVGEDAYYLRPLRAKSACRQCGQLAFLREFGTLEKGRYCTFDCFVIRSRQEASSSRRPRGRRSAAPGTYTSAPAPSACDGGGGGAASRRRRRSATPSTLNCAPAPNACDSAAGWRQTEPGAGVRHPAKVARAPTAPTSRQARARSATRTGPRTAHTGTQTEAAGPPPSLCSAACVMLAADRSVVASWSVEQTRQFVQSVSGAELAAQLAQDQVDGSVLLTLHNELLPRWATMPLGPVTKLISGVRRMRALYPDKH